MKKGCSCGGPPDPAGGDRVKRPATAIVFVAVFVALSTPAAAQGLADAARKAEEQRKSNAQPPIVFTQTDRPPAREVPLTVASFDTYINARVAMAKLWLRNRPLYERVRTGGAASERLRDFANILAAEPAVVELLKFYNLTPDTLVATEWTVRRAMARTEGGYGELNDIESENSAFMGRHLGRASYQIQHYYIEEAGLHAWPEWLPY